VDLNAKPIKENYWKKFNTGVTDSVLLRWNI